MVRVALWLLVGLSVWDSASCSIMCPDGSTCPDTSTCCLGEHGYSCCLYPKATCCADRIHCCPSGFTCNMATQNCVKQNEPWINVPILRKNPAEPENSVVSTQMSQELKSKEKNVFCDNYYVCPDGTTCCRSPQGSWSCCPYSPGQCCVGLPFCCPKGYNCDGIHWNCVRQNLRFPFTPKETLSPFSALPIRASEDNLEEKPMTALADASDGDQKVGVIRCDSKFFCSEGTTCCKTPTGRWSCCPYPLGKCCADGLHCCEYGYTCDPSYLTCRRGFVQVPSREQEQAKTD